MLGYLARYFSKTKYIISISLLSGEQVELSVESSKAIFLLKSQVEGYPPDPHTFQKLEFITKRRMFVQYENIYLLPSTIICIVMYYLPPDFSLGNSCPGV